MAADSQRFGFFGQFCPCDRDVLEGYVADIMFGVGPLYLDEVLAGAAIERNVFESDITDESGHFLAHILIDDRAQADELPLALTVDSDVFDRDVFEAHVLARLEKKRRHREMDDVEVAQG